MKYLLIKCKYVLIGFCIFFFCCNASVSNSDQGNYLAASALHPFGRFVKSRNGELELISSAVHFGFRFSGTECQVFVHIPLDMDHNYLQYTLDGVYQRKIKISGNNRNPWIISGLGKGVHTIWIYKATEATTGPIYIEKIRAFNIVALDEPKRPIIEFIGNSITCGAAADPSEVPCGIGEYHDQHNAYYAYGPTVARGLDLNFIVSSVSGIGIYRFWNTTEPSMSQVYEKTDFQVNSSRNWDFKTYQPRIVSIALGTNDFSDGDQLHPRLPFDSIDFVNHYIKFIQLVKSKYPQSRIALLSSPMLNGKKRDLLQNCLTYVKSRIDQFYPSDIPVSIYFFQPMEARGCGGHPNLEDHAIMAAELIPFYKKMM